MIADPQASRPWQLTPQRRRLRDYVRQYRTEHGCRPSWSKMMRAINTGSSSYTQRTFQMLVDHGELER